jgi:uncharacterized protein YllA (UPF0747 family)
MILPNLAYVGGPAEVVYWLQLKGVFDHFKIPFPMLMPRNFAAIMDGPTMRKFEKTGLAFEDLFEEKNILTSHWIARNSTADLSLQNETTQAAEIFKKVKARAAQIDPTLNQHVEAQTKRMIQALEGVAQRMVRAEKRKEADKIKQIEALKDSLFPNGSPQERTDNFLNFFQQDPQFISKLCQQLDPFDFKFNMLCSS